jgi:RNA polymerase sigma-70 factor (ECF subfamily)
MHERDIILRAQRGDHEAFGELVHLYQARLRSFAARDVESSHDVYDLVQDAFLDALRHLDTFDVEREFYPWLRTICRHRVLNYFRARASRAAVLTVVDAALEEVAATREDRADDSAERITALRRCLDRLPAPQRNLLELRYAARTAVKEIAARFEKTPASITMQLQRIKTILHECVQRQLGVPGQ